MLRTQKCIMETSMEIYIERLHMEREKSREPFLTVVMPLYNGDRYIKETLEHIIHIEDQPLELLLIDDGSSDKSGAICREYEALDERIR